MHSHNQQPRFFFSSFPLFPHFYMHLKTFYPVMKNCLLLQAEMNLSWSQLDNKRQHFFVVITVLKMWALGIKRNVKIVLSIKWVKKTGPTVTVDTMWFTVYFARVCWSLSCGYLLEQMFVDVIMEKHSNLPNTLSNQLLQLEHKRTHTSSSALVSARDSFQLLFFCEWKAQFTWAGGQNLWKTATSISHSINQAISGSKPGK